VIRPLRSTLIAAGVAVFAAGCAPRLASLPTGPGTNFPGHAAAYEEATAQCRRLQTMRAVLGISGRAAGQRFRASLDAGFAAPGQLRLELPAPGKPIFVLVAAGDRATLLLPRDERVLADAPAAATLEALAGIALAPEELRTIIGGCGFGVGTTSGGRAYGNGRVAVDVGDAVAHLEQRTGGAWQLVAAVRGSIDVRYADHVAGRPEIVRVRTGGGTDRATDLTVRLSQVDVNETLAADVFRLDVPAGSTPITLDELRQAGPLGR
jgi:hypothetical protein